MTGKFLFFTVLWLLAGTAAAAADPLAVIYSSGDELYESLQRISVESGIVPASSAAPWSAYELYEQLQRIDPAGLSPQGRKLYEQIRRELTGTQAGGASISLSPEFYWHLQDESQVSPREWIYHPSYRSPFLFIEADGVIRRFYWVFTSELRKQVHHTVPSRETFSFAPEHLTGNLIHDFHMEVTFPHRAFGGVSSEGMALTAGRDTLSWGRGNTGNLFIGDHAPYHDHVSFSASEGRFSYRFTAMQIDPLDDEDGETKEFSLNHDTRLFTAHRMEFRPSPKIALAFSEGTLFHSDKLDIRMFSPLMFLHNYLNYTEMKNFYQLDLDIAVIPGLLWYTELFIDQIQFPDEVDAYEDKQGDLFPNAFGVLTGLEFHRPCGTGYLSGHLEGAMTSTYLYLRRNYWEDHEPESTKYKTDHFNLDLVQGTNISGTRGTSFIGYRYGPDTVLAAGKLAYEQPGRFRVFADLQGFVQGEQGLEAEGKNQLVDTGEEYLYQLLPSGELTWSVIAGGGGSVSFRKLPVSLSAQIHTLNRWHEGSRLFDLQTAVGAEISFDIR